MRGQEKNIKRLNYHYHYLQIVWSLFVMMRRVRHTSVSPMDVMVYIP